MTGQKTAIRQKVGSSRLTGFKALPEEGEGTFEAIVSVFGNVDLVNDRVVKGAFAKSLADWAASGDPIPVIWSHQWDDPDMHIGHVVASEERDEGLWVKAQLDLEHAVAAQVWRLLSARRVREFSFAYDVLDEAKADDGANDLLELDVIEVGPTLKGANPETQLLDVKARPARKAAAIKAMVQLDGSREQEAAQLLSAVQAAVPEKMPHRDVYMAGVEATFGDHLVAYVEDWDQPWGGGDYYQASWSRTDDGSIEIGDFEAVDFVAAAVPKSAGSHAMKTARHAAKEGRRNSSTDAEKLQAAHDLLKDLGVSCETADADADGETSDPEGEDGDEKSFLKARPSVLFARLEADLLDYV